MTAVIKGDNSSSGARMKRKPAIVFHCFYSEFWLLDSEF